MATIEKIERELQEAKRELAKAENELKVQLRDLGVGGHRVERKRRKVELKQILQDLKFGEINQVVQKAATNLFVERVAALEAAYEILSINRYGRESKQSQDTCFGLCFGGCGIGKTELVTQFCMKMIAENEATLVLDLDNERHVFNRNACREDQWLGLSLAAAYCGGKSTKLSAFINMLRDTYGEESLECFNEATEVLESVVNHYRKWKNVEGTIRLVVWKDDYQIEMEKFSDPQINIIQNIGSYNNSRAFEQNVVLVPILSGTYGGDVNRTILGSRYSARILSTPPLSFDASVQILGISKDVLAQSSFKLNILISDIGGVARLLMDLRRMGDFSTPLEERDVDKLGSLMVNRVSECYSMVAPKGQQGITTLPKSALSELLRCIITGTSVSEGTQLPETKITFLDLNRYGIFHYNLLPNGRFLITMPYILLWKFNNEVSILPPDLLTFPCRQWTWQDFERLEAYLETLRAGRGTTIKEQFPYAYANADVLECPIEPWQQMSVERETVQCVPRTEKVIWSDAHLLRMHRDNVPILSPVIFLCHTGNPVIDSHSCRKSESGYVALLKQTKHSAPDSRGKVHASELIRWYSNAVEKFSDTSIFKAMVFIFFTNRVLSEVDRKKALAQCPNLIIICRDNLEKYISGTFLFRGLVDEEYRNV
ncbi:3081_t:CDS:2 [Ambispora gerdemannii]|uniref:3081_t:CDS:1 n=1 Tax=Ambispora gerdemannii TaxID=144530 RepID=A0A9N9DJ45_9GLOM|nr:3081_t:CDS:2 [Ambispora gerdemannii]